MEKASGSGSETKSVLVSVFGPTLSTPEDEQAKVNPVSLHSGKSNSGVDYTKSRLEAISDPELYSIPFTGSGSETKSVLVSVFGPTLSTPEDEQAKVNPVSLHSGESNSGVDYTKSRLEAISDPEFYSEPESSVAPENCQQDLSPPKSSSSVDNLLNPCGSICDSETCQHLKRTTFSSVSTSASERLSPGPLSDGFVTGYQIADENLVDSTPVEKLIPSFEDQSNEFLESSSRGFVTTGCQITDEIIDDFTPVEKLVSSLEDQCKEASDTTQLIPVIQRVGDLQRQVRISRSEEDFSPTPGRSPTGPAGQDSSQIEQRLQDLTEKEVVSKEKFDAFQSEMMQILGNIIDEIRRHHKFNMQVHQRVVPHIILCSRSKGTRQKILKTLTRGVKSVRLHMLCEQEGQEHKVLDVPGCKLHLKEGESWEAIYPFLNHGLRVWDSVTNVATRVSGVGGNVMPSAHAWLQDFNSKIVQPNRTHDTSQTPQAAAAQAAASKGAEQWLVKHLTGRDMMQDFGLQRMVFEKPNGSQPEGTIVWLCKEHAENGEDSHLLTNLPTLG